MSTHLLLATVLAVQATPVEAAPFFFYLPSTTENSALTMECGGVAPFDEITCHFTQVNVSRKSDEEIAAELAEHQADIEAELLEGNPMKGVKCDSLDTTLEDESLSDPRKQAAAGQFFARLSDACACAGNRECLAEVLLNMERDQLEICRVWTNTFAVDFRRTGPNTWVSKMEPSGVCRAVNATVIERDDRRQWTFRQTRISADQDSEICAQLEIGTVAQYSSDAPNPLAIDCKMVKFGH